MGAALHAERPPYDARSYVAEAELRNERELARALSSGFAAKGFHSMLQQLRVEISVLTELRRARRRANRLLHPKVRLVAECLLSFPGAIHRAPLSRLQRARCYWTYLGWIATHASPVPGPATGNGRRGPSLSCRPIRSGMCSVPRGRECDISNRQGVRGGGWKSTENGRRVRAG